MKVQCKEIYSNFYWRTNTQELLRPAQMETRHLVFSLRMVWNNFIAPIVGGEKTPGGKQWYLNPMLAQYWLDSVIALCWEVERVRNLDPNSEYGLVYYDVKLKLLKAFTDITVPELRTLSQRNVLMLEA